MVDALAVIRRPFHPVVVLAALASGRSGGSVAEQGYDPMAISGGFVAKTLDLAAIDAARKREIPIRVYLPEEVGRAPLVLFSHGLGGTREGYAYLGRHWAARGYVAVFLQHTGSDAAVWRERPPGERLEALRKAAGLENFLLRAKDVPAVLDALARWSGEKGHVLEGRIDPARIGMSGHSFGAVTTQAVSGQTFPLAGASFTDERIKAAISLSPGAPRQGIDPGSAFGSVKVPWLLMTGTKDDSPIGEASPGSRLRVFPALPPGGKYELVLDGAEHSAFSDLALPGDRGSRNPYHHRAVLALSTAFWDAWLRGDGAARKWLDGDGPRSVLGKDDRWRMK